MASSGNSPSETPYYLTEPRHEIEVFDAPEVPTVVVKVTNYPMAEMRTLFDTTFQAIFPALAERGISPSGPAFSLHHRIPDETGDFEVGVPVGQALAAEIVTDDGVRLSPSVLPAMHVAGFSYIGSYEGLGNAWGTFLERLGAEGRSPQAPFWELYVTEPTPDTDPATLRTDLYTAIQ